MTSDTTIELLSGWRHSPKSLTSRSTCTCICLYRMWFLQVEYQRLGRELWRLWRGTRVGYLLQTSPCEWKPIDTHTHTHTDFAYSISKNKETDILHSLRGTGRVPKNIESLKARKISQTENAGQVTCIDRCAESEGVARNQRRRLQSANMLSCVYFEYLLHCSIYF